MLHALNARLDCLVDDCKTRAPGEESFMQVMERYTTDTISKFEKKYGIDFKDAVSPSRQEYIISLLETNKQLADWVVENKKESYTLTGYVIDTANCRLSPSQNHKRPSPPDLQLVFDGATRYTFPVFPTIQEAAGVCTAFFEDFMKENIINDYGLSKGDRYNSYPFEKKFWSRYFLPYMVQFMNFESPKAIREGGFQLIIVHMLPSFFAALKTLSVEIENVIAAIVTAYKILPTVLISTHKTTSGSISMTTEHEIKNLLRDYGLGFRASYKRIRVLMGKYYIIFKKSSDDSKYVHIIIRYNPHNNNVVGYKDSFDCDSIGHVSQVFENIRAEKYKDAWFNSIKDTRRSDFKVKLNRDAFTYHATMAINESVFILVQFTFDTNQWCRYKVFENDVEPTTSWEHAKSQDDFFRRVVEGVKTQDTDPSQH